MPDYTRRRPEAGVGKGSTGLERSLRGCFWVCFNLFLASFPKAGCLGGVPQSLFSLEVLCSGSFWLTLSFACSAH